MNHALRDQDQRPLGELFSELAQETGTLVRQEVALAKTEVLVKAKTAAREGLLVVVGAGLALLAGLGFFAALILFVGTFVALWFAALIVGFGFAVAGAGLVFFGVRALKRVDPVPRETVRTMKENKLWLKEQVSQ
jgi:hypothetical protein